MGVLRFSVHPPDRIDPEIACRAYMCGPDRSPWQSLTRLTEDGLQIERAESDSGYFHIPWRLNGREVTLATAWLMERERPYHLEIELARGKINQLRNQLSDWQSIGLVVPPPLLEGVRETIARFAAATTLHEQDPRQAAQQAEEALWLAVDCGQRLATCYSEQALAARLRQSRRLLTQLAIDLGGGIPDQGLQPLLKGSFNAACPPLNWRGIEPSEGSRDWSLSDAQVEWCQGQDLRCIGGPLLAFDDLRLPDWLCLWEDDVDSMAACLLEFVQEAVERYQGKVALWRAAARINVPGPMNLAQEDRLKLAVLSVQAIHTLDPNTPLLVSFDQPWAEYMSREQVDSPLYLADTLVRAGLGITGLEVEINVGYHPGGSYLRDLLEWNRLLDGWAMLGMPLYVALTVPAGGEADPQARAGITPLAEAQPGGWSEKVQQQWIERYLPLILSKQVVQGVVWNQLRDAEPHTYPHGGLVAADGHPRGALGALAALRERYLR